MYVRFIAPGAVRPGVDRGLFSPAYDLEYELDQPEWLREALSDSLRWFEAELPVPKGDVFRVISRRRQIACGICWFRDDAREMIARALTLAALLREAGVPVTRLRTRRPGQILYSDAWQIVAKPAFDTPTRWH